MLQNCVEFFRCFFCEIVLRVYPIFPILDRVKRNRPCVLDKLHKKRSNLRFLRFIVRRLEFPAGFNLSGRIIHTHNVRLIACCRYYKQSDEDWEQLFALNLTATMKITRFYLQKMLEKKSGIIINMCSIASFLAGGGGAAYTASKHALAGLTKQIALDYADKNIQVFGLAPGAVKTAMTAADFEPGGLADWVAEETPIKRWLDPQEVADVSLFLASGKAAAMQGEIIKIDGGWSLK